MMMWEKVVLEREARCRIAKRGTVQVTWATSNNNIIKRVCYGVKKRLTYIDACLNEELLTELTKDF